MGRPERPLDPEAGPVQRLANDLRELRASAGSPSYRTMAKKAGFSATTLSQAAAGERLPSLAVVEGYARACGADPGEWEPRWKEAEAELAQAPADDEGEATPPYRGLARFEPDDRALFFGRDWLLDEVQGLVCGEHRFAVLFGASGSGKSSLLRAGLIPRLREKIAELGGPAVLRVLTPGPRPAATYGHLLAPAEGEPEAWVVVDQFEEVFTLCRDPEERARFLDLLLAARDPASRLKVLVAVRADFYARCAEHRGLADALRSSALLVGPMTADELRETVVRPAQAAGLLVERELTARIVEEVLDQPGALPMLSHALLETWRRRKGRMLTLAAYEAVGGVSGAIAASAEEVYRQLSPAQAHTARRLLLRMVEPGQGTPDTRRPLTRAELREYADPEAPVVLERLAVARLLTADEDGVHLAHEALIGCWPRLHGWVEEDRERLRHHRRLGEGAHAWLEHDRDPGALYRGSRLARAEELFPDHATDPGLTAVERSFLLAAFDAREAERLAAARSRRRGRLLVGALSGVLAVCLVVVLAAFEQHRDNDRQRTQNTARRIAAVADGLRTTDPRAALLLGVAAWRIAPLPETRRALLGSLAQPEPDAFTDPASGYSERRFLVDSGRTLLGVGGRVWQTWDVATHRRTGRGSLPAGDALAAGPDGRILALSDDEGVRLWDTAAGTWAKAGRTTGDHDLSLAPSGRAYLLGRTFEDGVQLRSLTDDRLLFETRDADRTNVMPSADDGQVVVCPTGHAPQVWDTAAHRTLPGDWERAGALCDSDTTMAAYGYGSPDRFAVVAPTGVHVWDIPSGRLVGEVADQGVQYASLSKDGAFLATGGADEIRIWRLSKPDAPVFRYPLNNQHVYDCLAWDPDRPFLRYLEGGTVHTLDLTTAMTSQWREQPLDGVLLSPDGRTLATARRSGSRYRFELRATRDGRLLRALPAPSMPVSDDPALPVVPQDTAPLMTFSPDGGSFAYGIAVAGRQASPQRFTVWDVHHDWRQSSLDLSTSAAGTAVVTLALDAGGRTLYTTRTPDIGMLSNEAWDTASHRRTSVVTGTDLASLHLAVRPDGGLLVGDNRSARLPGGTGTPKDLVQGEEINALAFSPGGSGLAAGDKTGRVALWDGDLRHRAGVLRNVFPAPLGDTPEAVSALALSPDGRTLAVGGDAGTLQLWDTATQQPLGGPLPTPGEAVETLAFSGDDTTLYAGARHVPIQRYAVDPDRAVARVCLRAGDTELTTSQWRTYVPDAAYRKVCGRKGVADIAR
ncbi:nSTAND1 domain-containing NTPase [Streptomyces sp. NPDC002143]